MHSIKTIFAYEILDSRGNPTVECTVFLDSGINAKSSVPSGASTGRNEAFELRDKDLTRYLGKGAINAVHNINNAIYKRIVGMDVRDQLAIDNAMLELDGTSNLERLGANAILAVSQAVARVGALSLGLELYEYLSGGQKSFTMPVPFMNIINGGAHAGNNIDIQEFMIVPVGFATFKRALQAGCEIYHALGKILKDLKFNTGVGDEGGYAPNLLNAEHALDHIIDAITKAGYKPGEDVYIALDVAANEFYKNGSYVTNNNAYSSSQWVEYLDALSNKYPIISIEDGLAEDDFQGWQQLTSKMGSKIQLVGDDLFVTQKSLLSMGIEDKMANSVLVKPNQVGSISAMLDTVNLAKKANYKFMISHRSGDTEDAFIADLAVALGSGQIKTGSPCRGERVAKYNRLLEIEHTLGHNAKYAAKDILAV